MKTNVRIHLQDFNAMGESRRGFEADWDLPRRMVYTYTSELSGVPAAEEAFFLFNAPLNFLTPTERARIKGYKGHSLSVGDVVEVDGTQYLCAPSGWVSRG